MGSCASKDSVAEGTKLSTVLKPTKEPDYYTNQCNLYFDTLDMDDPVNEIPTYSRGVVRFEWPPWWLLTGKGRDAMIVLDILCKFIPQGKARVVDREHRFFEQQPFGRSRVKFEYDDGGDQYEIYEEFTFNDKGECTFIEAWSSDESKGWDQGQDRLSTQIPGLGDPNSNINLKALHSLARTDRKDGTDEMLVTFSKEMKHPVVSWFVTVFRSQALNKPKKENSGDDDKVPDETLLASLKENKDKIEAMAKKYGVQNFKLPELNDDEKWSNLDKFGQFLGEHKVLKELESLL